MARKDLVATLNKSPYTGRQTDQNGFYACKYVYRPQFQKFTISAKSRLITSYSLICTRTGQWSYSTESIFAAPFHKVRYGAGVAAGLTLCFLLIDCC